MELRPVQRNASCRGCDKNIAPKSENIIYMYSVRNRGQNIFLCRSCVDEMVKLFEEGDDNGS